ncbi:hypothetical protein [Aquisphaera insulae]|uniref:hypothetical protein n=1 Tax=Aquisphaera insulae TaxID=2712864 RepID=UPI0013E9DE7E|nr:hypothetical protein [Aquisphaera insulae]
MLQILKAQNSGAIEAQAGGSEANQKPLSGCLVTRTYGEPFEASRTTSEARPGDATTDDAEDTD